MTTQILALILFIAISSIKSLYFYSVIGLDINLLLIHIFSALGFSTIFVLLTLKSKRHIWFVMWYLLHAFYLLINTNYYEYLGKFFHLSIQYLPINEVIMLIKHFAIPLDSGDLLFVIDFPLFLYLLKKHGEIKIIQQHYNIIIRTSIVITFLSIVMLSIVPKHFNTNPMAQIEDYEIVSRYGIVGDNINDLLMPSKINDDNTITYGQKVVSNGNFERRPNIILIQIESLDANIINYQYNGKFVTPFLQQLTTKSIYFPFTLCYRKLGGTSDCEIAVNNSIEPRVDFALMMNDKYQYPNSVVKVLKNKGYSAEAFHGNTGLFWKRFAAYVAMGYDNFFDPNLMKLPEKGWGVPDHEVMNFVENHLQKKKSPFFVSIITLTSHEPFNNFKHFTPDTHFDGVEPELTRRYFESISYTDRVVGEFVRNIQKKYPDTYFFLYGDHTPYVINEGSFRRSVLLKGEAMEMVPLFIITPNGQCRYERDAIASYLDIAPTILHASGVPYIYRTLGVDLLSNKPLQQPVIYRGHSYDRSKLFKEISETYKDL